MKNTTVQKSIVPPVTLVALLFTLGSLIACQSIAADNQGADSANKDNPSSPVIESIDGDRIVLVKTPQGNKVGAPGTRIEIGDRIKTGPKGAAKIRFADGSKLIIGRSTEMEVRPPNDGVPTQDLIAGEIRGIIRKPKLDDAAAKRGPRFMVRTRSAVMGVRGTDFVYSVPEDKAAAVHTLQGTVEVASNEETIMEGKGQLVRENQFVEAKDGMITPTQAFNREQFVQAFAATQPESSALVSADAEIQHQITYGASVVDIAENNTDPKEPLQWLNFEVAAKFISQPGAGATLTSNVGWTPFFRIYKALWIRPSLCGFSVKSRENGKTNQSFGATAMVFPTLFLGSKLTVEGGVGFETWSWKGSGRVYGLQLGIRFAETSLVERVFGGVRALDMVFANRWKHEMYNALIGASIRL